MRSIVRVPLGVAGAAAAAGAVSTALAATWWRNWGSTSAERAASYPGDDMVQRADTTTYAVTVDAPPEVVWSWLVQIGQGRGGMYSYEWLENAVGLDIHNAQEIRDEWQHLAVGDSVRVVPAGKIGMMPDGYAFRVALVEAPSALVLRQQPPEHPWDATWAFLVVSNGENRCRLLSRSRSAKTPGFGGVLATVSAELMRPLILLMTRRMLLGIKERAERERRPVVRTQ